MEVLSADSLLAAALVVSTSIDNLWNIFMAIHLAILTGFALGKPSLRIMEVLIAYMLYIFFVYLNAGALIDNYHLLIILHTEASSALTGNKNIAIYFQDSDYGNRTVITIIIHAFCAGVVLLLLLRNTQKRAKNGDES